MKASQWARPRLRGIQGKITPKAGQIAGMTSPYKSMLLGLFRHCNLAYAKLNLHWSVFICVFTSNKISYLSHI